MTTAGWFLRSYLDGLVFGAAVVVGAKSEHWKMDNHGVFLIGVSVLAFIASVIVRRPPARPPGQDGTGR